MLAQRFQRHDHLAKLLIRAHNVLVVHGQREAVCDRRIERGDIKLEGLTKDRVVRSHHDRGLLLAIFERRDNVRIGRAPTSRLEPLRLDEPHLKRARRVDPHEALELGIDMGAQTDADALAAGERDRHSIVHRGHGSLQLVKDTRLEDEAGERGDT